MVASQHERSRACRQGLWFEQSHARKATATHVHLLVEIQCCSDQACCAWSNEHIGARTALLCYAEGMRLVPTTLGAKAPSACATRIIRISVQRANARSVTARNMQGRRPHALAFSFALHARKMVPCLAGREAEVRGEG